MAEGGGGSRSGCEARDGARPVLVVSLPTHRNPRSDPATATELKGADVLPEEIVVWEILVRLPAPAVLRCRAVCNSWRRLTSRADFLLAHHRRQPSLPLVVLQGGTATDPRRGPEDSESKPGRRLLGFDEYNSGASRSFELHGSCDGLLLLSLSDGRFSICNPATRQHTPLPALTNAGSIVAEALYLHGPSGEYRVLYWNEGMHLTDHHAVCYVIDVPRGRQPTCIGVPAAFPGMKLDDIASAGRMSVNNSRPPVLFRGCLHWDPGRSPYAGIVVFDTVAELFRWMRCAAAAATGYSTRLHDMGGSIALTCFEDCRRVAKIWVLADYEGEVWSFKYKFPVESIYNVRHTEHLVLSHKCDMLVEANSGCYMFHCDSNGKLLHEFYLGFWGSRITGHRYKESLSLVKYDFFPRRSRRGGARVGQPHFFR